MSGSLLHATKPLAASTDRLPGTLRRAGWLLPAAVTLAVTLVQVDQAQLWRDELATWSAASRPLADLLRMVGTIDAVAGPYYLFMHAWIEVFGDSVQALRMPTVLAMTVTAGLTTVLGQRLTDARTGLIAGLLFAVVPSTSRYAQEARAYALATLFAVLATLLLLGALERPGWWRWLGYTAAVTALGLAHLVATTLVAGHAVAVLLARRRTGDRRTLCWLLAITVAGLSLTPLALLGQTQHARQLDWVDRSSVLDLPGLPGALLQAAAVGGIMLGLAAVGLFTSGLPGVLLGACVVLPTTLLFAAGLATPLWVPRYLVFVVPFGCLLAAITLSRLRFQAALPIVAMVAVLGAPAQADLRRTHESPRSRPMDYAAAARIIDANDRPGDGIVYSPRDGWRFLDTAVAYHLRDNRPRDVLLLHDQVQRGDLWATECDQVAGCLATTYRVWLLVTGQRTDPLHGVPEAKAAPLRTDFRIDRLWQVPGLTVALLTRARPAR